MLAVGVWLFVRVSNLPAYSDSLSKFGVISSVFSILGALAAAAAVIFAVTDRAQRERPIFALQVARFTVSDYSLSVEDALVNVGGGPAIRLNAVVTSKSAHFTSRDTRVERTQRQRSVGTALEWKFDIGACAADSGIGSPLINTGLTKWITSTACELLDTMIPDIGRGPDAEQREHDRRVGTTVAVQMPEVSIKIKHTDRGQKRAYESSFSASISAQLQLRADEDGWLPPVANGTIRPPDAMRFVFSAAPGVVIAAQQPEV